MTEVQPVSAMDDETFIRHLEHRHSADLKLTFPPEPDRVAAGLPRRLGARSTWDVFHNRLHKGDSIGHTHT